MSAALATRVQFHHAAEAHIVRIEFDRATPITSSSARRGLFSLSTSISKHSGRAAIAAPRHAVFVGPVAIAIAALDRGGARTVARGQRGHAHVRILTHQAPM